jgi:hypothetical protein
MADENVSSANITINEVDITKPWFCLTCKQTKIVREQEKTITDLQRELALACDANCYFKS